MTRLIQFSVRLLLILLIVAALLPILWFLLASIKDRADLFSTYPLSGFHPTIDNYTSILQDSTSLRAIGNSLMISISSTIIALLVSVPAAWTISGLKKKSSWLMFYLSLLILPPIAITVPLFFVCSQIGMLGSPIVLLAVYSGFLIPFGVFFLVSFFEKMGQRLRDHAKLDDLTGLVFFRRILFVEARGVILLCAFFMFFFAWSEFGFALVLTDSDSQTIPISMIGFITPVGTYWGKIAALGTVGTLPILFGVILFRKQLVSGLTFGLIND